ncbi:MAG: LLM class flavin-dependent oxidoreductase [Acidimicrobiales bacterium]
MAHSLSLIPTERRSPADGDTAPFFVGNMIPTVIDDDIDACRARNRKTLRSYVALPNYRNYWKAAGYEEEMTAAEVAMANNDSDALTAAMTDRWLDDCTLSGPAGRIRDEIEAWFDAGVTTPIIVPSSVNGGQTVAFAEFFALYA